MCAESFSCGTFTAINTCWRGRLYSSWHRSLKRSALSSWLFLKTTRVISLLLNIIPPINSEILFIFQQKCKNSLEMCYFNPNLILKRSVFPPSLFSKEMTKLVFSIVFCVTIFKSCVYFTRIVRETPLKSLTSTTTSMFPSDSLLNLPAARANQRCHFSSRCVFCRSF